MGHIWNQSVARRSLMGAERTHNPSPAASHLLGKLLGKRRTNKLVAQATKRRRSFHRGNPVPALIGVASSLVGGKLAKRLRSPAAITAADNAAVDQLVPLAIAGSAEAREEILRRSLQSAKQNRRDYAKMRLLEVDTALATQAKAQSAATAAERRQAAREAAAAKAAGRSEILQAGTSIAGSAAQALLGRGRSLPRRKPKRRRTQRGRAFSF